MLSTLSAEVQDEAIFNGQPPPESAHLIWTRLFDLYGKSKCDDALEIESMERISIVSSYSEEASQNLKSAEPEQEVQAAHDLLSACMYRTCPVCLPDVSGMAEAADQQAAVCSDAQARWRPSDESTSVSHDTHHLCLMAKKSKKKNNKKDQEKEKAQVDDQDKSDIEVEDNYNLDHLNHKDKFIIMKIVERMMSLKKRLRSKSNRFKIKKSFLSPNCKS